MMVMIRVMRMRMRMRMTMMMIDMVSTDWRTIMIDNLLTIGMSGFGQVLSGRIEYKLYGYYCATFISVL